MAHIEYPFPPALALESVTPHYEQCTLLNILGCPSRRCINDIRISSGRHTLMLPFNHREEIVRVRILRLGDN